MFKNNFFTLVLVFVLLAAGGIYFYGSNFKNFMNTNGKNAPVTPTLGPNAKTEVISITCSNFKFTPSQISVNTGDLVKITLKDSDGMHTITFPDFHVQTKTLTTGQEETIQFIAYKTGTFSFYDSYAHHKEFGMIGTIKIH